MKKISINKSHKMADLSDLMLKFKKGAFVIMAGLNMAVFFDSFVLHPQEAVIVEESIDKVNVKDDLEIARLPENSGVDKESLLERINNEREKQGLPILATVDKITVEDLKKHMRFLDIKYTEGMDLSWLKICKKLGSINFYVKDSKVNIDRSIFANIPEKTQVLILIDECNSNTDLKWMKDCEEYIKKLSIYITDDGEGWNKNKEYIDSLANLESLIIKDSTRIPVNEANYGSIKNIKSLRHFKFTKTQYDKFGYGDIDPQLFYDISNMPNMRSLGFPRQLFSNLDYTKFGTDNRNLYYLYMSSKIGPGDIAISLTPEELDYLEKNKIIFLYDEDLLRVKEINEKISQIIKEINFREDLTDEEKRNEIVKYLCRKFQYDSETLRLHQEFGDDYYSKSDIQERKHEKFYKDGELYGALESETQLCGNYAAAFNTVAERVGLESYLISSNSHTYNLVNIDGEYVLVDPTWIDSQDGVLHYIPKLDEYEKISVVDEIDKYPEAAKTEIRWLHIDFSNFNITDPEDSHYSLNVPENVLQAIEESKNAENDKEMKKIFMGKLGVYSIGATIGCFLGYLQKKRRKQREHKETNREDGAKEK